MKRTTDNGFDPRDFIRNLSHRPGVYRMLDAAGEVMYVGKARDLKKRLASYFQREASTPKIEALVRLVAGIEVTVTATETEALLLEYNLIKKYKPRFNITYRDDKSYPYIRIATDHAFPRLSFYRGSLKAPGNFYGPYPSAHAVRETLGQLQKLFQVRQCEDTFFANRNRPCLQYQIQRCSAPCVGLVSEEEYAEDVGHAVMFLEGRNRQVTDALVKRMEAAAGKLQFEKAAQYRDQVATLNRIQESQFVSGRGRGDFDVLGVASRGRVHCVAVMVLRSGRNLGSRTYFPRSAAAVEPQEVLSAFVVQHYLSREAPREILTRLPVDEIELLQQTLAERAGHAVEIRHRVRSTRARWLQMAQTNAEHALNMRLASNATIAEQLEGLREMLGLDETPSRLECFDISHTGGESTVAACVVFGPEGAAKAEYRRFNIHEVRAGDDYAAMRQVLERRYTRIKRGEAPVPDVLFVDGGKGQVAEAAQVLEELQLPEITILGVAKGPARRPGMEQLFRAGEKHPVSLSPDSPVLHLIQQVRDEAHRFAITGHRARRARSRRTSVLEAVPGLGPKRRRELLRQFGGLQGVARAPVEDLAKVKGISRQLAKLVYETFHAES